MLETNNVRRICVVWNRKQGTGNRELSNRRGKGTTDRNEGYDDDGDDGKGHGMPITTRRGRGKKGDDEDVIVQSTIL